MAYTKPTISLLPYDPNKKVTASTLPYNGATTPKPNLLSSDPNDVSQYSNDYAAEINRRLNINQADPLIPALVAAREDKIRAMSGTSLAMPQPADNTTDINRMYAGKIQALRDSINQQAGTMQGEIDSAPQAYQPMRNEASLRGAQDIQRVRQDMLDAGLFKSGDRFFSQGGEAGIRNATQGNINNINMQQAKMVQEIKNRIAQLRSEGTLKEADMNAQSIGDIIGERNRAQARQDNLNQLTFQNDLATKEFGLNKASADLDMLIRSAQLKIMQDPNSTENRMKAIELERAQEELRQLRLIDPTLQNKETQARINEINTRIQNINADTNKITNPSTITPKYDTNTNFTVDDYVSMINKQFVTPGNQLNDYQTTVNKEGIINYLESLSRNGVSDEIVKNLMLMYGIDPNPSITNNLVGGRPTMY
jgi:hypothetical protein